MKTKQRLIILSGVLVVIAVFLGFGVISSTVKLFGGTSNNTINNNYEEEIRLGEVKHVCIENKVNTQCGESGDYSPVLANCARLDYSGVCYERRNANPNECGNDDGIDYYVFTKYNVVCDNVVTCGKGEYVSGTTCKQCDPGYSSNSIDSSTSCTKCTGDTYAKGKGNYYCNQVPANAHPNADNTDFVCNDGYVYTSGSDNGACVEIKKTSCNKG